VALKFLPSQLAADETDQARFLQEAKAASAINYPDVCIVYDIQECDGSKPAGGYGLFFRHRRICI